ncbi:MAG: hypothetical protein HY903_13935 [Deltaproteobacteria bacterium]|nr:hypothetical protein [Deltaproteobacteria bacterium]
MRPRPPLSAFVCALLTGWALLSPTPTRAAAPALLTREATPRCDLVDVAANRSDCDRERCELDGEVTLRCGDVRLWADRASIQLGTDQSFAGADAFGHVTLVDGTTVLSCDRLHLGQDRVQGRLDAATIHVKRPGAKPDPHGKPLGRDQFVFAGDIERRSRTTFHVEDAWFTQCDCGAEPPSWRLGAKSLDADLDDRATLWRPQLYINPFGLGLVPLTPPLLPLSVPLTRRAAGLLAPKLTFYSPTAPTVDLPLFVPFGESWDVTLAPGLRTDWGEHRLTPPSTWGAPRLGLRLRAAPADRVEGEVAVQWTEDRKHQAARIYEDQNPSAAGSPELAGREKLVHRVSVESKVKADLAPRTRLLTDLKWASDDLVAEDFRVSLSDRVTEYVPSRAALSWRQPYLVGVAAAEFLERLQGSPAGAYSNTGGADRRIGQRGPALRLSVPPTSIAERLHVDADLSYVRYGPYAPDLPPLSTVVGTNVGLSYLDALGPLAVSARALATGFWTDLASRDPRRVLFLFTTADAELPLFKRYGDLVHRVALRAGYRAIPWRGAGDAPIAAAVDERFALRTSHQGAIGLDQSLYRHDGAATTPLWTLSLAQPWDLTNGETLQAQARLTLAVGALAGGSVWSSLAWTRSRPAKELGGGLWLGLGPARVGSQYTYISPQADRLRRSIYELGTAGVALDPSRWVHSVSPFASVGVASRLSLSYATDILLAVPETAGTAAPPRDRGPIEHRISVSYHSPCDCWDLLAHAALPAKDPLAGLRAGITLSVAGYALGSQ